MANIATWLTHAEESHGELIEAIVVGLHENDRWHYWHDDDDDDNDDNDRRPEDQRNVILSREQGLTLLNEEYDNGYGGAGCFPMYAWSANWLYTISEYDGATSLSEFPRHPIDCEPGFS